MSDLNLNRADTRAEAGEQEVVIVPRSVEPADLLLMVDIESLALGPRPVITQLAMLAYELEQDELMEDRYSQYLPIDPQQQIIPPRRIQASTIAWWMKQSDEAREAFELSTGTDFEELVAAMRGFVAAFNRLTKNGTRNYEITSKHPQFDIVAVETLLTELGLEVPWDHRRVTDLATDLIRAGIKGSDVPKPAGTIPHVAYWDVRWQIEQWLECRRIRSGGRA